MNSQERDALLQVLQARFGRHMPRHPGMAWAEVRKRLDAAPAALEVLQRMEASGGEPDVVSLGDADGRLTFVDCSPESPTGRRVLLA